MSKKICPAPFSAPNDKTCYDNHMKRRTGILLHPTSLPSPYGIGDFGAEAYRFVDFLHTAGVKLWEVLPLKIPDCTGSPYATSSSMAGNWILISPDLLIQDGLLEKKQLPKKLPIDRINHHRIKKERLALLEYSYKFFQVNATAKQKRQFFQFKLQEAHWLPQFALYKALKYYHHGKPWWEWAKPLANHNAVELKKWTNKLEYEIKLFKYTQWVFFDQWNRLKQYANTKGVKIFGDLPFFVAHDSVDVWANRKLFLLDKKNMPTFISGAPPDYFSEDGQLWGDPQYNWKKLKKIRYQWWIRRFHMACRLYDIIRLDHFRGYKSLWHIPGNTRKARDGKWAVIPGEQLFKTARKQLGKLPIVAEDLGTITQDVITLREEFKFPGMRVLLFGLNGQYDNFHLPKNYPKNCVAYTGTHDNNTARGWITKTGKARDRQFALRHLSATKTTFAWKLIEYGMKSNANTFMMPLQDIFNLGSDARMNKPSTMIGNWSWRFKKSKLTPALAKKIKRLVLKTRR